MTQKRDPLAVAAGDKRNPGRRDRLATSTAAPVLTVYYHKGRDSAGNIVYWTSTGAPNLAPTVTTPVAVGAVSDAVVIGKK
jgi:hypothetical protein